MRVAVAHDWLVSYRGGERVLASILREFPHAPVFTTVFDRKTFAGSPIADADIRTSFVDRLPFARKRHRGYLPLMPIAVEQFDLSDYDVVVSSSHAVAKGVITGPDQLHVSYVHSPMRYAWDLQHQYLRHAGLERGLRSVLARWMLHKLRIWDVRTAHGVDEFVANSRFIARRIKKVYGRDARVIYPPVDVDRFALRSDKSDYYVTVGSLVPYKKVDLLVRAFGELKGHRLVVIGDGPERRTVEACAGKNVEILGFQPDEVVREYVGNARAFVFAAEEDFGIAPVEAQACGTPVIAFGKGGALETVVDGETGLFFGEQTVESIVNAVRRFDDVRDQFDPETIRRNAERFSEERFRREFAAFVCDAWEQKKREIRGDM